MNGFEEKAGPIHSAEDYVNALKDAMKQEKISYRMSAVKTLLDSANSESLQMIIDRMDDKHLDYFLKLQSFVLDGTLEQMNEISYQEQKDKKEKEENSSLKSVRLLNFILFETPNPENVANNIKKITKNATNNVQTVFNNTQETAQKKISESMNYISNTIENIQYFVKELLSGEDIKYENKIELIKHLYDSKGYLLMKFENGKFEFDSYLNQFVFEKVKELVSKKNVRNIDEAKEEMQNSQPEPFDILENVAKNTLEPKPQLLRSYTTPANMQPNLIEKIKKFEATLKKDFYKLLPPQLIKHDPRHKITNTNTNHKRKQEVKEEEKEEKKASSKRKREDKEDNQNPKKQKGLEEKAGGKPRRQTRRKIRRNKKTKTKKRKVNKKTKKRKTNKKTKVNRKKSKKRRTKK